MAVRTYTLLDPITFKVVDARGEVSREQVFSTFDLDFPDDGILRAKHLRATDGHSGFTAGTIALVAYFAGVPIKVVDECSERDLLALYEMVEGFRKAGGLTGETSSPAPTGEMPLAT